MDRERFWGNTGQLFGSINPARARLVGDIIHGLRSTSVLDLGCGNQAVKGFLELSHCKYIPTDLVKRSDDCLVLDLETEYPAGFFHTILSIGLVGYLRNRRLLYLRVARSCEYWISSVSAAAGLVSMYEFIKRSHSGLSEELFTHEVLEYFNLCGRRTCITGCRVLVWAPKSLQDRRLIRELRKVNQSLSEWNVTTKGDWLRSHMHRRTEYINRIISALDYSAPCMSSVDKTRQRSPAVKTVELIEIKMNDRIKTDLDRARRCLDEGEAHYIIIAIGYSKKDADSAGDCQLERFDLERYNEMLEKHAMKRYRVFFSDLTPDYDILTVFQRSPNQPQAGKVS